MFVGDRMSRPVVTVYPEATLEAALDRMQSEHIHTLPVVNKRGEMVGILSDGDIYQAMPSEATTLNVWEQRDQVRRMTVNRYMTREVVSIDEKAPIEAAACLMADNHISTLPVLNEGRLTGIISRTDLFKVFLELLGARDPGVRLTAVIPKGPGQLLQLSKAIYDLGGDILALGTFMGADTESGELVLKVAGVEKDELVEGVKPHVVKIKDARETNSKGC